MKRINLLISILSLLLFLAFYHSLTNYNISSNPTIVAQTSAEIPLDSPEIPDKELDI